MTTIATQRNFSIVANDTYETGDVGPGLVSTKVFTLIPSGSYNGSISVQGRPRNNASAAFAPIDYRNRCLNGAATDSTVAQTAAITPTGTCIIAVDASGLDIALVSSGSSQGAVAVSQSALDG